MKTFGLKLLSFLLCLSLLSVFLPSLAEAAEVFAPQYETVEVWARTDIILTSNKRYDNPYLDVEIDAVFTHEDGTEIVLYGFWDGGDEWRVRFSPTKVGLWSYVITCNDTANTRLHNVKGKLMAVENTGSSMIDKHGFVKISDDNRHFVYDDGTPFFWLGDTNWQAPNYVTIDKCNYPGCSCGNQFVHEVNDRLAKGFTVYQTYFDSAEMDGGGQRETTSEPSMWTDRHTLPDTEVFTKKFDVMFDYLAAQGMTIVLGYGIHSAGLPTMDYDLLQVFGRYITARYASYPVIWMTAQEITGDPQYDAWMPVCEVGDKGDGYDHPFGAHMYSIDARNPWAVRLDGEPWHDFFLLQAAHGPVFQSKFFYESYYNNDTGSVKPFIEGECNYEDITCMGIGFNGYEPIRIGAWKALMSGSYGFTYGVTGIWANNYTTAGNVGWYESFSHETWYMGLDKPGSFEMSYMKNFFEKVDFTKLVPRYNDSRYSDFTQETHLVSSSEDNKTYVAYFYNNAVFTGKLYGLNEDETYFAYWYNPLTGKYILIADDIKPIDGCYEIPQKPTAGDWTLLVSSRNDFKDFETEQPYIDDKIDTRVDYAKKGSITVSSFNGSGWNGDKAIDGDYNTYWCASDGTLPQTITLDMKESVSIREINLAFFTYGENPMKSVSFSLEGSLDGDSWSKIYQANEEKTISYQGRDLVRITKDVTYRYLKLSVESLMGESYANWATLAEWSVYDSLSEPITPPSTEEINPNLIQNATAMASSDTGPTNNAAKGLDGSKSTYWCAPSETNHQFTIALAEKTTFDEIVYQMYAGTTAVSYKLEGSDDNLTWTPLAEATEQETINNMGLCDLVIELDQAASFKYVRITFVEVFGKWATVFEASMYYQFAEEEKTNDTLPTYQGNVQTPYVFCGGSAVWTADEKTMTNSDIYLTDGDIKTEWVPFGPIGTQTILLDMNETKKLYGIEITLGKAAMLPEYRIFASNDGSDWTLLADATLREATAYYYDGYDIVSETLSGEYRFVKILWLNGLNNSVTKTIAEIKLYAEGETPEANKTPDITALQTVYDSYKKLLNSEKTYTEPSYRKLVVTLGNAAKLLSHTNYVTTEEVAAAKDAIQAAYDGLVKTTPSVPNTGATPDTSNTPNTATPETGPSDPGSNENDGADDASSIGIVIAIVVAVVVLIGGGIAFFIIQKKKRA